MANFASIAFVLMQSLLVFTMLHAQLSHSLQSVACNFTRSASVFKFATEMTFDIVILMFYILRLCCVQQQNIAVVNWLSCYFEQVTHRCSLILSNIVVLLSWAVQKCSPLIERVKDWRLFHSASRGKLCAVSQPWYIVLQKCKCRQDW